MLKEFREFIAKGNVIDLAVGIIIGAAFTAIVNSLVKDIINPVLGLFGSKSLEQYFLVIKQGDQAGPYKDAKAAEDAHAVVLNYGAFLSAVLNFLIVAFVVFLIVKAVNHVRQKFEKPSESSAPPAPPRSEVLLEEIRDELRQRR